MIKHQAYFDFLASMDSRACDWQPVLAGLALLRLVDSRLNDGGPPVVDWASLESVRGAVNAIHERDPVRPILTQLFAAVCSEEIDRERVGHGLLAYGRALNLAGRWALSCEIFGMADRIAGAPGNPRISIESGIALGAAARRMADWDLSAHAYARAAHLATTVGDATGVLQVEVGIANTHMVRGNLPAAESALDRVIEEARAAGANDVLGLALHSRGTVAHLRGAYADAVRLEYDALEVTADSTARDGILSDIAAAFAGMGMHDAARDSYLIVSVTSQSQWVRWQAALNLMELAALDGREEEFDSYARELKSSALDPRLRAYYFLHLSAGERNFGRESEAEASLAEGLAFAANNQLHQIAHEASVSIESVKKQELRRANVASSYQIQPSVSWIASELSSMREAATSSP